MAEFPALPLFTDAYLGDTTHLTTIEHGAYLLLLMVAWRSRDCQLPDDDRLLSRYSKTTPAQWRRLRPILSSFFDVVNGHWKQRRLTDEFNHVRQVRESQRSNGVASALKRKGRHSTAVEPSVNRASTPSPSPTPKEISISKDISPRASALAKPDGVADQIWVDFKKQRKKPVTLTALTGIQREADKAGVTLNDALAMCCERGWQGFNSDWIKDGSNGHRSGSSNGSGKSKDGFINAIREARAHREADQSSAADGGGVSGFTRLG